MTPERLRPCECIHWDHVPLIRVRWPRSPNSEKTRDSVIAGHNQDADSTTTSTAPTAHRLDKVEAD